MRTIEFMELDADEQIFAEDQFDTALLHKSVQS